METLIEKIKREKARELELNKQLISGKDFIAKELPENQWIVDKLIPVGMTILSSAPGQFKTYILLSLCKQITRGELGFNHFKADKRNVLFVNEEMGERAIQDRMKTLDGEFNNLYFTNLAGVKLEDMNIILKMCKEKDITLVVFDSLTRIHNLSENDASDVKKIYEAAKILLKEGISTIMTHHHRKVSMMGRKNGSDEMRGSTDLLAMIDCHLAVDEIATDKSYLVIKQLKLRQAENMQDFKLSIDKSPEYKISFSFKGSYSKFEAMNIKAELSRDAILKIIEDNPGSTKDEMIKSLEGVVGQSAIRNILPVLEKDNLIYAKTQKPKTYHLIENKVDLLTDI